tara:strand:- start:1077 stop:1952 length:876 start_codon:yes stop_codon:yes gene_type:complete
MDKMIVERGDYWHPDPDKDRKLGGPGANQRAREDRAAASKPKSDPKKLRKGESYMDYAKRHGYKSPTKKKSLLGRLLNKEHHQKDKEGKVIEHGDGTPSSVEEEIKMTRKAYNKLHKDFKSDDPKKPRTTKYVPGKGTVSMPVKFVDEGKGYQPEIEHSKLGDAAKKKAEKKRKAAADSLPPHLKLDAMRKAFAHTNESNEETLDEKCWKGYKKKGMKTMFGKRYPNCVKANEENEIEEGIGDMAIKAIEKTKPPYLSKRSKLIRDIKLKQLKSYLKKQDEKKAKAKMKKS